MCKPSASTTGVGWVFNTASCAGPCHCVWPYNVQATGALDISSSVCLAIKYQSPATHTYHFPLSLKVRDITVLAGEYCVGHKKKGRKTNCSFRWNLPAGDRIEGKRESSFCQENWKEQNYLLEGALVTEQKVCQKRDKLRTLAFTCTERGNKKVHVSWKWSRNRGKISMWASRIKQQGWSKNRVSRRRQNSKIEKSGKKKVEEPAAGLLLLIQHFNKSMPLENYNPHPELS